MLLAIEKDKAKKTLNSYFNKLKVTGYVKHPVVTKYLIWLFLVDFVERVYMLLTDEDYNYINNLLICIFNNTDCLLRYHVEQRDFIYGNPGFKKAFRLRISEDNKWRLIESGDAPRTTETNTPLPPILDVD